MSDIEQNENKPSSDEVKSEETMEEIVEETTEEANEDTEQLKETVVKSREKPQRKLGRDQNTVYIGNKPAMNYVLAAITAFNTPATEEVTFKARGRAITTAVDVAEILRNRFLKDTKVHSIAIGTEELAPREGGSPRNVSIIEIVMTK